MYSTRFSCLVKLQYLRNMRLSIYKNFPKNHSFWYKYLSRIKLPQHVFRILHLSHVLNKIFIFILSVKKVNPLTSQGETHIS